MKLIIYVVMFILGGAVSASLGIPVLSVYISALLIGLLIFFAFRKLSNKLPQKAFDKVNQVARDKQKEITGEPYITTHHGPNGYKGIEVGFNDEEDGQPGAGSFNPTEVARDAIGLQMASQLAEIMTSNSTETAKQRALHILEQDINQRIREVDPSSKKSKRRLGISNKKEPYGISQEDNYSI